MKKKILIVAAVITIVALCAVSLVSCATSPYQFIKKMADTNSFTVEMYLTDSETPSAEYAFKNGEFYIKMGAIGESYGVKSGDKFTVYSKTMIGGWTKTEITVDSEEYKEYINDVKGFLNQLTDAFKDIPEDAFVKKDGYWTVDDNGVSSEFGALKMNNGALEMYVKSGDKYQLTGKIKTTAAISVPSEAKEATK